jgi:hypothetical protein
MRTLLILAFTAALAASALAGSPILVGPQGQYLGRLNSNRFDPDSVANPFGPYGSRFSPDSINNPFGRWGSRFSPDGVRNPFGTGGPRIIGPDTGLGGIGGLGGLGDD